MLDFIVQVAAANKLSPSSHTIAIFNEETGRPLEYKASQTVGALVLQGVSTMHLVDKKKPQKRTPKSAQFEVTMCFEIDFRENLKIQQKKTTYIFIVCIKYYNGTFYT